MKQESDRSIRATLLFLLLFAGATNNAYAQGTTFTYQGRLQDAGTNANGSYDFQFTLWDASSAGTQEPQPTPVTVTRTSVAVTNGAFTVQLDFGASAFPGPSRFLETSVRLTGSGSFTLLSPRQPITSTPYAIRTLSGATADALSSACVSCVQKLTDQFSGRQQGQWRNRRRERAWRQRQLHSERYDAAGKQQLQH